MIHSCADEEFTKKRRRKVERVSCPIFPFLPSRRQHDSKFLMRSCVDLCTHNFLLLLLATITPVFHLQITRKFSLASIPCGDFQFFHAFQRYQHRLSTIAFVRLRSLFLSAHLLYTRRAARPNGESPSSNFSN